MNRLKVQRLTNFFLSGFLVLIALPSFAECVDLKGSSSFELARDEPQFLVTKRVLGDGSVLEERRMTVNGVVEEVETVYWNGVIAIDRKSKSGHIQLNLSEEAKSVDLSTVGQSFSFPVTILVNGNEVDSGRMIIETIDKTALNIAGCQYRVMVVRSTINRNDGSPINEETLLSLDAGIILGNITMTPDWQPKTGVFFDRIEVN